MRCLFRMVIALVGLVSLVIGGFLLYVTFLDTPDSQVVTLGGASATQQEIYNQNPGAPQSPDLLVVRDGQASSSNIEGPVVIGPETAVDLGAIDGEEAVAAANQLELDQELLTQRTSQASVAATTTTDIQSNVVLKNEVLSAGSEVQVFSLNPPVGMVNDGDIAGQGGVNVGGERTEQRVVEFEWPEEFRSGESGVIRLTLKALPQGGLEVSSPEIPTNAVIATPIVLTDCHDAYAARVNAVLVAPDFDVSGTTGGSQPLARGSSVTWRWTLTPKTEGDSVITAALNITWTLKQGVAPTGGYCDQLAQAPFTFWGQSVQVEVNKVLGLITIRQASIAGTVLAVLGFVGQVPFLGEIAGVLFERQLEQRQTRRRR